MGRNLEGIQGSGYQFAHFLKDFVYVTNCLQVQVSDLWRREEGGRGPSPPAPQHPLVAISTMVKPLGLSEWLEKEWQRLMYARKYPHLEQRIFCVVPFMVWKEPTAHAPDDWKNVSFALG